METLLPTRTLSPQDERVMAALAHVSALLPMIGLIAPIVIWVTQREKSRFVAFQALQAIAFQLVFIVVWFAGVACYIGSFFLTMFGGIALAGLSQSTNASPLIGGVFLIPFLVFFLMILLWVVMIVYGVVAAVMTFQGKDFRYLLVGRWVERYSQRAAAQ